MSLSAQEQRDLRDLMVFIIPSQREEWVANETVLNEQTIEMLERFLAAGDDCHRKMGKFGKALMDIAGGFAKGWLRRALGAISKEISKAQSERYSVDVACYSVSLSKWVNSIKLTYV